ncbi:1-phosphatidylinositol 4,5-bisphosphate phosphodiesterase epsilon-1-like [Pollicipes pollicipes]|uniref:1-phosphatidylinositol 4,5-bisphosphate phosphodiesterase epsilon-1-like n=1 Tax=Pollicipes pollicipes TaxID=41117 RepID=UPI0018849E77|nr:1-phosphatidylinositol 4,5-bisphosphate phosphodiesterase epsilon-1-like [Pollicipes pollicipes]
MLEFRGSRWTFSVPNDGLLRDIGRALWAILQNEPSRDARAPSLLKRVVPHHPSCSLLYYKELEDLQKILHFPEQLALSMTETEHKLFSQVSAIAYIRYTTCDLTGSEVLHQNDIQDLLQRFNEVRCWVTHLVVSQPTDEDRRGVLSCLLRAAQTCWNLGNFHGAAQLVAGLRSEKLRPFWASLAEKEDIPVLDFLFSVLEYDVTPKSHDAINPHYTAALQRALAIKQCKVVPFFGVILRRLRGILTQCPSLAVVRETPAEVISEPSCENFSSPLGVGGLINMEKLRQVQLVVDEIQACQNHATEQQGHLNSKLNNFEFP